MLYHIFSNHPNVYGKLHGIKWSNASCNKSHHYVCMLYLHVVPVVVQTNNKNAATQITLLGHNIQEVDPSYICHGQYTGVNKYK